MGELALGHVQHEGAEGRQPVLPVGLEQRLAEMLLEALNLGSKIHW